MDMDSDDEYDLRFLYWVQVRWQHTREIAWESRKTLSQREAMALLHQIQDFCKALFLRPLLSRSVFLEIGSERYVSED